ncbi:hypothetical protein ACFL02_09210 [Planctomycetota bacterium]
MIILFSVMLSLDASPRQDKPPQQSAPLPQSTLKLKEIPFKIVYETYRKTDGKENWELFIVKADGAEPVNLTKTPDIDEMYPHVSPDGKKICFVVDEGKDREKRRHIYYMNIDGTNRVKVADNARQPCWSADSKTIAYLKAEYESYTIKDFATRGLLFYNLETAKHTEHVNKDLHHLYNICFSPDSKWFVATVHGGMSFSHAILAFKVDGTKVYDLTKYGVTGCRPDFSSDGEKITWGMTDWDLGIADIDFSSGEPKVSNVRRLVHCAKTHEVYHTDFSPDDKYIAFSYGPKADEMVGGKAPGWNICITDLAGKWTRITTDGHHNKEPDWASIKH